MIKPVKYTFAGIPVYRDGDLDLNHQPNAHGDIYIGCQLSDHKDQKRHRLQVNLRSGFIRCMDPECVQVALLESHYDKWTREHESKFRTAFDSKKILKDAIDICSPEVIRYLREERGFQDLSVFKRLGIKEIDYRYTRADGSGTETVRSLCFPFLLGDKVFNVQYKRADGVKDFRQGNGVRIPYNINSAVGALILNITEGEMDCAALVACGYESTVSMPNGSNSKMDCFDEVEPLMASVQEIVFAVDGDKAGSILQDKLYAKFGGSYDCYTVSFCYRDRDVDESEWFDAKDANECLKKGGEKAVKWCMAHKREVLSPHVVTADSMAESMDDIFYNGLPVGVTLGLGNFDRYVKFMTRQLYIVTGMPSSGKTNLIDFWITRLSYLYGWNAAVFSPEKDPGPHFMEYIHRIVAKPADSQHLTLDKFKSVRHHLSERIVHLEMGMDNTVEQILKAAEEQVRKRGIKVLVIDPFNYISLEDDDTWSESRAINNLLITLKTFAKEHDILVILMAHPKKTTEPVATGSNHSHPHLYDISGSAAFYNVCDMGIIINRVRAVPGDPRRTRDYTEVIVEKAREHGRMGDEGTSFLWYSKETSRYAGMTIEESHLGMSYGYEEMDKGDWDASIATQQDLPF